MIKLDVLHQLGKSDLIRKSISKMTIALKCLYGWESIQENIPFWEQVQIKSSSKK